MCNLVYNNYLKKRIDEIVETVFDMRSFELLMVWVDENGRVVSERQYVMRGFSPNNLKVSDRADAELEAAGVV